MDIHEFLKETIETKKWQDKCCDKMDKDLERAKKLGIQNLNDLPPNVPIEEPNDQT